MTACVRRCASWVCGRVCERVCERVSLENVLRESSFVADRQTVRRTYGSVLVLG